MLNPLMHFRQQKLKLGIYRALITTRCSLIAAGYRRTTTPFKERKKIIAKVRNPNQQ